jgi:hypothetical protein
VELSAASNGVDSLDIEGTEDGSDSSKGKEFHLGKVNGMGGYELTTIQAREFLPCYIPTGLKIVLDYERVGKFP